MTIPLRDRLYGDTGLPVQGATVQAYLVTGGGTDAGTASTLSASTTTDVNGVWKFAALADPGAGNWYDVKIINGQQVRWRYGNIQASLSALLMSNTAYQVSALGVGTAPGANGVIVNNGTVTVQSNPLSVDALAASAAYLTFPHSGAGLGSPASTGDVRLVNNRGIAWRNANGTGDDTLVFDGTDTLVVGGGLKTAATAAATFQGATTVDAGAGTGAYLAFPHSGAGLGSPAAGGDIRFLNNKAISWRNAAGTADVAMYVDTNNQLHLDGIAPVATGGVVTGDLVINIAGVQYRIALKQ